MIEGKEKGEYMRCIVVALAASAFWVASGMGATYFVDYADGDDNADGASAHTPWKHAPGDANATGNPAGARLSGGDRTATWTAPHDSQRFRFRSERRHDPQSLGQIQIGEWAKPAPR